MPCYYASQDSIECAQADLSFRRIAIKRPPEKHPVLGLLYRFKLTINGKACINKELDPKKAIINANSHLNIGDEVQGNILLILTQKALKKSDYDIERGSSTHRIQVFLHRYFTFAKIENQYPTVPKQN